MIRKVYNLPKAGSIANLTLEEEELPDPGPGEVQIEVKAIGLNFADIFSMFGIYSATPKGSFVPGLEYAGIISKVGKDVVFFEEGELVMGVTRFGAYASYINIGCQYITALPEGWSFQEGAAYPVQALTAYYALISLGSLKKNQTVLIHSAAGGVGILANRIAKAYDATTIGSIGSEHKMDFCYQEGYDKVIVRDDSFEETLRDYCIQHPLNLVLECIGGKYQRISFEQLAAQGRLIVYGAAQYASSGDRPNYAKLLYYYLTRPKLDPQAMIQQNKSVMAFNLIWLYENHELMVEILEELTELEIGKPFVGHEFSFDKMLDAIHLFQSGQTIGKVVINV